MTEATSAYSEPAEDSPRYKLMSASEAISRFVRDGDSLYSGYTQVPMALAHEIIRQGKRDLEVIGASLGMQANDMILGGACSRVRTGYVGGALRPGPIQDRMRDGSLRYDDYSNGAIAMMLCAGAMGLPFAPVKWFLGTDYLEQTTTGFAGELSGEAKWHRITSPFDGEDYVALPAIRPDVAIMHFQRADRYGNVQGWGAFGDARWGMWAAERVIVSVEEIVPTEVVRRDPNRTLIPGSRVAAVVHEPWGAHPTSLPGFYDFDYSFIARNGAAYRDAAEFEAYAAEWIHGQAGRSEYLAHIRETLGEGWLENVTPLESIRPVEGTISYGYAGHMGWQGR